MHHITNEHIFLSALGDNLSSNYIICKPCNNKLGEYVDGPFINELSPLLKWANIHSHNHKIRSNNIKSFDNNGECYLFNPHNGEYKMARDYIKVNKSSQDCHKFTIEGNFNQSKSPDKDKKKIKKIVNRKLKQFYKKTGVKPIKGPLKLKYCQSKPKLTSYIRYNFVDAAFEVFKMGAEFAILCGINPNKLLFERYILNLIRDIHSIKVPIHDYIEFHLIRKLLFYCVRPTDFVPNDVNIRPMNKIHAKLWTENHILWFWVAILGKIHYKIQLCQSNKQIHYIYNGNVQSFKKNYPDLFRKTKKW